MRLLRSSNTQNNPSFIKYIEKGDSPRDCRFFLYPPSVGYKSLPLGGKVLNGHEVSHEADEGTTFPIDVGLNETVRPPRMPGVTVIENMR